MKKIGRRGRMGKKPGAGVQDGDCDEKRWLKRECLSPGGNGVELKWA